MQPRALLSLCLLTACASGDFVDRLPRSSDLRAAPPAAFTVAVAPLRLATGLDLAASTALGSELTTAGLHAALVADLQALRAASAVVAVGERDLEDAEAARADLLLRPRLVDATIAYEGASGDGLLSSLLWITTWVGGLFVADSDYVGGLEIDWQVVNPHNGQTIADLDGTVSSFRLSFVERNAFLGLHTLQSLLIPPPLTSDDAVTTARSIVGLSCAHAAGELTAYLKAGFDGDERDLLGELRLESPKNGAALVGGTSLRGALLARDLVTELAVLVDGRVVRELDATQLPPRSQQQVGASTFRVPLPELELTPRAATLHIVVEYVAGGRRSSRTVVCAADVAGGGS